MTKISHGMRHRGIVAIVFAILVSFAPAAYADPLDDAKSAGYVGEKRNGMLGLVDADAPADVKALINSVNAKRKEAYADIARKNGTSLTSVAALAGEKAIAKTSPGNYIQTSSGDWKKK